MPRHKVAPTKSNFLRMKQDLEFAQEGHELLEQKRQILVSELMALTDRAKTAQQRAEESLQRAYRALEKSIVNMGRTAVMETARAVNIKADISITERGIMGVEVPVVETRLKDAPPYYSLYGTSFWLDETINEFRSVLGHLGKLAEVKISLLRLAREVKRTVKRVNALEKVFLPDYNDTLKYIQDTLEEQERQTIFVSKLVRNRLEKKNR